MEILGQGFTSATSVKFGGAIATATIVSGTYLTAVIPANGVTGLITVTTPSGTLKSSSTFKVVPKISGFNPISGCGRCAGDRFRCGFQRCNQSRFSEVRALPATVL